MASIVTPSPGSSFTSRTVPSAGPALVVSSPFMKIWVSPTSIAISSGSPSPVLALEGTRAMFLEKYLTLSKRSGRKPYRDKVPIIVYILLSRSVKTSGLCCSVLARNEPSGDDFHPGIASILLQHTRKGVLRALRIFKDSTVWGSILLLRSMTRTATSAVDLLRLRRLLNFS